MAHSRSRRRRCQGRSRRQGWSRYGPMSIVVMALAVVSSRSMRSLAGRMRPCAIFPNRPTHLGCSSRDRMRARSAQRGLRVRPGITTNSGTVRFETLDSPWPWRSRAGSKNESSMTAMASPGSQGESSPRRRRSRALRRPRNSRVIGTMKPVWGQLAYRVSSTDSPVSKAESSIASISASPSERTVSTTSATTMASPVVEESSRVSLFV